MRTLLILISIIYANSLGVRDQVCGNSYPCQTKKQNYNTNNVITLSSNPTEDQTELYGDFANIMVWPKSDKKNFLLYTTSQTIDCAGSKAFIYESAGDAVPLAQCDFMQHSPVSCEINFDLKINNVDLLKVINIDFAIAGGISTVVSSLNVLVGADIVPGQLPHHAWDNMPFPDLIKGVKYTLLVQDFGNSMIGPSCQINSTTMSNTILKFVERMNPQATVDEYCHLPVTTVTQVGSGNSWLLEWELEQASYIMCPVSTNHFAIDDWFEQNYYLKSVPEIEGCTYPDIYGPKDSHVAIAITPYEGEYGSTFAFNITTYI